MHAFCETYYVGDYSDRLTLREDYTMKNTAKILAAVLALAVGSAGYVATAQAAMMKHDGMMMKKHHKMKKHHMMKHMMMKK